MGEPKNILGPGRFCRVDHSLIYLSENGKRFLIWEGEQEKLPNVGLHLWRKPKGELLAYCWRFPSSLRLHTFGSLGAGATR